MKKYNIAICDDEKEVRSLLHSYTDGSRYDTTVKEYSAGEELIKDIDSGVVFDILFLDIAMGSTDGIDTAKELGKRIEKSGRSMRASRPLIIFVTGIPDRMGDAFGVRAYGYLLKPVSKEKFISELHRAVSELENLDAQLLCETSYENRGDDNIILQSGKRTISVSKNNILYVESNGRKAIVHLKGSSHEVYKKMEEFEEELGRAFFRIHRGYLVNLKHVSSYSREELQIDNGDMLIMSKYKYPDFTRAYLDYIS